jgi:ketosteroid isomerase-like protein
MKKIPVLIVLLLVMMATLAQKKNGEVFIEHPAMDKVDKLWNALEEGDKTTYGSLLADTVMVVINGNRNLKTRDEEVESVDWWNKEFENLEVVTDTPAYADAIDYKESGVWVQDWLRLKGTHKETGINLDLSIHNLYSFNDEGQISSIHHYSNNDVFQEINRSKTTRENGKVYIGHPYITKVRKLANAYCDKDLDAMKAFYADDVFFSNTTMKLKEQNDMEAQTKVWESQFSEMDNINMKQVGYPDCIYYALNDDYVVYSWWIFTATSIADGKKIEFPMMLSHTFNDEGKIVNSMGYYSSNHYE